MSSEFSSIQIHGTYLEPLFLIADIRILLKTRIRPDKTCEEGTDYIRILARCADGGIREQLALTEQGLYTVLARNNSAIGRRFRAFITTTIKEMRLRGCPSLDKVLDDISQMIRNDRETGQHLYLIKDTAGWTKIGKSNDPAKRLLELQTGNPLELRVSDIYDNCGKYEILAHQKAKQISTEHRGEWFRLTSEDELHEWIENIDR